jgi:hypothetical protein
MRQVAVVAWREMVEHRVFVWAAFAALAMTVIVPFVPAFFGWSPGEVREVLTWVMALVFSWTSAVILGLSTVSGTVSSGRFGFFLSHPLNGFSIWFGKLLGVLATVLACQLIVVLPAFLMTRPHEVIETLAHQPWFFVVFLVGIPLLIVLLAHALATVFRSKSPWIAVDIVALGVAVGVAWMMLAPLARVSALKAFAAVACGVGLACMTGLLAAGAAQAARGGVDPVRHHRVYSIVLWAVVGVMMLGTCSYWVWMTRPELDDIRGLDSIAYKPGVPLIVVKGPAWGRFDYEPNFLVDLDSGQWWRLRPDSHWSDVAVALSGDGRRIAWAERKDTDLWQVTVADISGSRISTTSIPIFTDWRPQIDLSPDGRRIALIEDEVLTVADADTGKTLTLGRLPKGSWLVGPTFVDGDTVEVISTPRIGSDGDGEAAELLRLDVADGIFRGTTKLDGIRWVAHAETSSTDGRTVVASRQNRSWRWLMLDPYLGVRLEYFEEHGGIISAALAADGRTVQIRVATGGVWLETRGPQGETVQSWPLPGARSAVIGGLYDRDRVVVGLHDGDPDTDFDRGWRSVSVDLESGRVTPIGDDMKPVKAWGLWGRFHPMVENPGPATRLFIGGDRSLMLWDPRLGVLGEVVPGES